MAEDSPASPGRPGVVRRAAAGAWHVPAGFAFLLRHASLWPIAALPVALAVVLVVAGAVLGIYVVPLVESRLAPSPGSLPEWVALPVSLLLWVATIGAGTFLGLGLAFALVAPLLELLSRRVEERARGTSGDSGRGLGWELGQSLRGAAYFLAAAPVLLLLGLVPVIGPLASALFGSRAVALQMTDAALTRRGAGFRDKLAWHKRWRAESAGFGLAGMLGLLVPFANLLLGPALVTGGTLLVLDLEDIEPTLGFGGGLEGRDAPPQTGDR
jgi:CysZ protein